MKIGIIGIGFARHVHVPAFRLDPRCQVTAIAATTEDRAAKAAQELQIPKSFGDWRALVNSPEVDAVSIAVPPLLQAEIASAAVRAGKHIFLEKPVAATLARAEQLWNDIKGTRVVHAMNCLFPEIAHWEIAKQLLAGGAIGELRHASLSWQVETQAHRFGRDSWKTRVAEGGGTLNNFGSHALYNLEWFLGRVARAEGKLFPVGALPDTRVDALLEFENGARANVLMVADAVGAPRHRLEFQGREGRLILQNETADYADGFVLTLSTRTETRAVQVPQVAGPKIFTDGRIQATSRIAKRFIDAILNGSKVTPGLEEGIRVERLMDAIRASDAAESWRELKVA